MKATNDLLRWILQSTNSECNFLNEKSRVICLAFFISILVRYNNNICLPACNQVGQ